MRYVVYRDTPKAPYVAACEGEVPRKGETLVLFDEDSTKPGACWEVTRVVRKFLTVERDPATPATHVKERVDVFVTRPGEKGLPRCRTNVGGSTCTTSTRMA
jgi:hypothetical protein